jgi:flagellar biosynthetic protein FlhB
MAEEDRESRTEAPTEKKITDAIERGNVPFSREASIFASVSAMLLVGAFLSKDCVGSIAALLRQVLDDAGSVSLRDEGDAAILIQLVAWEACKLTLAPLAVFAAAGVLSAVAQNAPRLYGTQFEDALQKLDLPAKAEQTMPAID